MAANMVKGEKLSRESMFMLGRYVSSIHYYTQYTTKKVIMYAMRRISSLVDDGAHPYTSRIMAG